MPHDGFDDIARAAVVQAVAGSGADGGESAAPERRGPAPARANVVHHAQTVLHHVGVRPDLLVRVARQTLVTRSEESVGVCEAVGAGGPTGTVAGGASNLAEEFAPALDGGVLQVARCGHGQTAVPNHKVGIIVIAHLNGKVRLVR